jgi:hypothetical protein
MSRPSLAQHAQDIALLKQAREHDAEHDEAVLEAIRDLGRKLDEHRVGFDKKIAEIEAKHTALDKAVGEAKTLVRGFSAGWAAAFMFIGGLISLGISNVSELFK